MVKLKISIILIFSLICLLHHATYAEDIKILMFLWNDESKAEEGFKDVLAKALPDKNIKYSELNIFKDLNRLEALLTGTDETQFDLIYTYGSKITSNVAENYTKIPIVFNIVFDPITYKIIESWDQKKPNLTGASNSIPIELQIKKIQKVFGKGNIGFIYNQSNKKSERVIDHMQSVLAQEGFDLIPFKFNKNFRNLRNYLNRIKDTVTCIYLPSERLISSYHKRILSQINRNRIPTCVTNKTYLKNSALLCLSVDYYNVGKIAGELAVKILNGIKPLDLPVQRPSESDIQLYLNSRTLKKLKIKLPSELNALYIK